MAPNKVSERRINPFLTEFHRMERLNWARLHVTLKKEDWMTAMLYDEKIKFGLFRRLKIFLT